MGINFVIDIVREIIGWKYAKIGMIGCRMIIREVLDINLRRRLSGYENVSKKV